MDYNAIHHIDCASQAGTIAESKIAEDIEALDNQAISTELPEQVQFYDHNGTKIPRQQRTVGKTLEAL